MLIIINTFCLLLAAIISLPYGYYILLKFLVCFTAIREIFLIKNKNIDTVLFLVAIAALYNPIIRIPLGKNIWCVINILTAVYFIYRLKAFTHE